MWSGIREDECPPSRLTTLIEILPLKKDFGNRQPELEGTENIARGLHDSRARAPSLTSRLPSLSSMITEGKMRTAYKKCEGRNQSCGVRGDCVGGESLPYKLLLCDGG